MKLNPKQLLNSMFFSLMMLAGTSFLMMPATAFAQDGGSQAAGHPDTTLVKDIKDAPSPAKATKHAKAQKKGKHLYALIKVKQGDTELGTIKIRLFTDNPKVKQTAQNFVDLAEGKKKFENSSTGKEEKITKHFYDGLTFHRIIPGFMVQGGDPKGDGTGGPGYKFKDSFDDSLKFSEAGVVAMANSGPNTNGSQFFITVAPTTWLDGHYSIFGQVEDGMDVVMAMSKVPTAAEDRPTTPVVMEKVTIKSE